MFAISISRHGGPEVLEPATVADPAAGDKDVLVAVDMAGVNYIDTYYREGIYPAQLPFIPGLEGVGRVISDPRGQFAPGTRIAWSDAFGSYAQRVAVDRDKCVVVPDSISDEVAASMLLQGMTAHYLSYGIGQLGPGSSCLLSGGAGGVGLILTQMAAALGATVHSVVSTDAKEELAREAGAHFVYRYGDDLAAQVRANAPEGVDVVFDGVGKSTFEQSLRAVRPRGIVALFGAASGPVPPLDPQELNKHGSIFLTRPSLGAWTATPEEYQQRAQAVVQAIADGTVTVRIGGSYPLREAAQAHRDLQSRATTGSLVLRVDGD